MGTRHSFRLHNGRLYSHPASHCDCNDISAGNSLVSASLLFNIRIKMNTAKMLAIVLVILGVLVLAYGGFSYTKETHNTKIGPIELSIKDKKTVNLPIWVGVGAIAAGLVLLFVR